MNKRIWWVDYGKGIVIFFVLFAHVIKAFHEMKEFHYAYFPLEWIQAFLFSFIMPAFFGFSGYLFYNEKTWIKFKGKFLNKLITFGIPYVIFSILYVVLQHLGSNIHFPVKWSDLLFIWAQPIRYLWFLYTLLFVWALTSFMFLLKLNPKKQLLIYIIGFLFSQLFPVPFIVSSTFSWVLCFYLGYLIRIKPHIFMSKKMVILASFLYFSYFICSPFIISNWSSTNGMTLHNFLMKLSSIILIFAALRASKENSFTKYFSKFGPSSMIIYLVHVPTISIFRVIFMKIGLTNLIFLIFVITFFTWEFCLFTIKLCHKFKFIDFIFFPNKYLKV